MYRGFIFGLKISPGIDRGYSQRESVCEFAGKTEKICRKRPARYMVAKMHRMPYQLQVSFQKRATNYRAVCGK